MPIYEYRCTTCSYELEALQKMHEPPLQTCPNCKGTTLQKKISAVAFRLKGSGWYETDFKGEGKKNIHGETNNSAETKTSASTDSTDKAVTEAKSPPATTSNKSELPDKCS